MHAYVRYFYALLAGACFMFAAMATIEYQENIAPSLDRVTATLAKLPRMLS